MRYAPLFALFLLSFPWPAFSDLQECNGTWTNVPCDSTPERVIKETTPPADGREQKDKAQRSLWFHDLEMKQIKARREYKLDIDIEDVRAICNDQKLPSENCKKATLERRAQIDTQLGQAEELKLKKKEAEKKTNSDDPLAVPVVVQNNDYYATPTPYLPPILPTTPHPQPLGRTLQQRPDQGRMPPHGMPKGPGHPH
jgi:hypothetical protein